MRRTLPATPAAVTPIPLRTLLDESWTPAIGHLGQVVVLTDRPDLAAVECRARSLLGDPGVEAVPASAATVDDALLRSHARELDEEISNGFPVARPGLSARSGVARWQLWALAALGLGTAILGVTGHQEWLLVLSSVPVTVNTALAVAASWARLHVGRRPDPPVADDDLPSYTILVPAYREEAVIGTMMRNLEALDYPSHLLDVIVLVEQHDPATEAAALAASPPGFVRIMRIPPGSLQTKPRTCNLGLQFARGEMLVIFDAEDRPQPDQLRRAAARFAAAGPELACVQAELMVSNGRRNLITRSFELEYAMRWKLIKPGLARLGLPIPLGGTSNHFRTEALRMLGGWDAWNVTEDADLGMRCAAEGRRVDMIDSITWEESVTQPGAWIRQRTRWNKGSLVTTMVHTRNPVRTWRQFGWRGSLVLFGLVLGNVLTALLQPLAFWLSILYVTGVLPARTPALPRITFVIMMVNLIMAVILNLKAARMSGVPRPWLSIVLLPAYGLAQTWAAVRAVIHVIRCPFYWDKTPHCGEA